MYEKAKVGISWKMPSCLLLRLTIYLFLDGSGDSPGSGDSDGSRDSDGSQDSGNTDKVGKSTKLA